MKKIFLLVFTSIMLCNTMVANTSETWNWDYIKQLGSGLWSALPGSDTQKAIGTGVGAAGLMACTAFACYILKDPAWKTEFTTALKNPNKTVKLYSLSNPGTYQITGVLEISQEIGGLYSMIENAYALDSKAVEEIKKQLTASHTATTESIDINPKLYTFFTQLFNSTEGIFYLIESKDPEKSTISTLKITGVISRSIEEIAFPISLNQEETDQAKNLIKIWKFLNHPKNNNRFISPLNR